MTLKEKLDEKLKFEGRSAKWFVRNYLPEMEYFTALAQIRKDNKTSEKVEEAIKKYLGE